VKNVGRVVINAKALKKRKWGVSDAISREKTQIDGNKSKSGLENERKGLLRRQLPFTSVVKRLKRGETPKSGRQKQQKPPEAE